MYCQNFKNFICKLWLVYPFRNGRTFLEFFTLSPLLNSGLVYFMNDLL